MTLSVRLSRKNYQQSMIDFARGEGGEEVETVELVLVVVVAGGEGHEAAEQAAKKFFVHGMGFVRVDK